MAYAAYQLQSTDIRDRFIATARASFASDTAQARFVAQYVSGGSPADLVEGYMSREHGTTWCLFDLLPGSPPPMKAGAHYLVAGPAARGGPPPVDVPASLVDAALAAGGPAVNTTEPGAPYAIFAGATTPYVVLVEFHSLRGLQDELTKLRRNLELIALVVAALGVAGAIVAAKRIQRPVQAVGNAARQLGEGRLDTRVPVRGRDEVAELARSFNSMAQQVGDSIAELHAKDRQQRRFVADVAHDLRTPVAAMVAAVDGLDHAATRERSTRLLGAQARRLARLVEDLLEMSRFDAGAVHLETEPVDLADLWADASELVGADIGLRSTGDVTVNGDPRRLHTIARNLLTNALTHGAPPVTVDLDGSRPEEVTVRVADHGPGVPDDLLRLVFDRFVRGDRARTATQGSGLGLAIAQENARLHGGLLVAANASGAVFTLTLPRAGQGSATVV
ncbi:HAMP domain-containing histidine kinase [Amycolatopsis acidiphila]|uniref:Signal transduction histidine-protein kinase/phosphatase MprB n=2 Tax=Amycolatopsis acidiphila TaxID=715473 RepID=A0A558A4E1_9PSEU|nr:HAMP domain-containing histidine kinase [Amycolatopsis acidiphila]